MCHNIALSPQNSQHPCPWGGAHVSSVGDSLLIRSARLDHLAFGDEFGRRVLAGVEEIGDASVRARESQRHPSQRSVRHQIPLSVFENQTFDV